MAYPVNILLNFISQIIDLFKDVPTFDCRFSLIQIAEKEKGLQNEFASLYYNWCARQDLNPPKADFGIASTCFLVLILPISDSI